MTADPGWRDAEVADWSRAFGYDVLTRGYDRLGYRTAGIIEGSPARTMTRWWLRMCESLRLPDLASRAGPVLLSCFIPSGGCPFRAREVGSVAR